MKLTIVTFLFVTVLSLFPNATQAHPFHVSMCEVKYNTETQSLEVALKLFVDDLNLCLRKKGIADQYFGEDKELASADTILSTYIKNVFTIDVDGQDQNLSYLGKEFDNGALWAYFEIPNVPPFKTFGSSSTLFFEIFDDQQNIIQLDYRGKTRSLLLHSRNSTDKLTFD